MGDGSSWLYIHFEFLLLPTVFRTGEWQAAVLRAAREQIFEPEVSVAMHTVSLNQR